MAKKKIKRNEIKHKGKGKKGGNMFVTNILIPALSLIISTIAIIIGVYNYMLATKEYQCLMDNLKIPKDNKYVKRKENKIKKEKNKKKHLIYKIPYEKESEYLELIFTLNLFLDSYDLLIWSVEINRRNNFESYLHIETNKVDKLRAVAIEYTVEEIRCEECLAEYICFYGRIKGNREKIVSLKEFKEECNMAWVSGTEVFKVINKDTRDEEALFRDVNRAFEYVEEETAKHGKNLKVIRDTMEVWIPDEELDQ